MSEDTPGRTARFWQALWRVPQPWWRFGIPLGGIAAMVLGAALLTAFVGAVEMSSTETFCISCHEMRDNVYEEYKSTIHYSNRTGVRATCPDCHVPDSWGPKLLRKLGATFNELPNHFLGKIDTPAKFEAHRARMAQWVWDGMKANDSHECRNCHKLNHMDLERQDKSAARKHKAALEKNQKTCIDCHQGIAHKMPEMAAEAGEASE